jgi:hypothetical protein
VSGTRAALAMGIIPIAVGLFYLVLQVALGDPTEWLLVDGQFVIDGDVVAKILGNVDPAGVILLLALGLSMGFGFLVILRGARDL